MSKAKKVFAKGIASTLKKTLRMEANSTSCAIIYQPKEPQDLSKYRKAR